MKRDLKDLFVLVVNNCIIQWGYKSGAFNSVTITYPVAYKNKCTIVYTKNSNRGGASYDNESFILSKPTLTNFSCACKYGNGGTWIGIGY